MFRVSTRGVNCPHLWKSSWQIISKLQDWTFLQPLWFKSTPIVIYAMRQMFVFALISPTKWMTNIVYGIFFVKSFKYKLNQAKQRKREEETEMLKLMWVVDWTKLNHINQVKGDVVQRAKKKKPKSKSLTKQYVYLSMHGFFSGCCWSNWFYFYYYDWIGPVCTELSILY